MHKYIIKILILSLIGNVFATENIRILKSESEVSMNSKTIHADNLSGIDSQSNDLYNLSRQAEIAKKEAEIRKIKNGGLSGGDENAQTVVTGIAIDLSGKKIAWLQFADGGDLAVNLGSKVGQYTVAKITMNGVTLKGEGKQIFLKRVYSSDRLAKNKTSSLNQGGTPSPVVTQANNDANVLVPPIISNN